MKCWKCGYPSTDKIGFRSTCEKCYAWLHCCKNCKNYQPGLPNDCKIPGTEQIRDREASNFCDDFVLLGAGPQKFADPKEAAKKLFKDDDV